MIALPMFNTRTIATTGEVADLLKVGAPVAMGVSGGKDSSALALATNDYLDSVGHTGPRLLIHSDLGMVEWQDSLPTCERIARATGLELVTVRRAAGGMMERWETRWANNVARYADLLCVKLILPWSTASMRFCTSELKTAVICRELIRRFPGRRIVSATGIRRDESANRAKAPVAKWQAKLTSKAHATAGMDWNPIIDWQLSDVLGYLRERSFDLHEAYTRYGSSRVSCAFCILGSKADLAASARCAANHDVYRRMVNLEVASTFSFQDSGWLGDVAPHLLDAATLAGLDSAKRRAAERERVEARIPEHLLYTKGWPTVMPTPAEARLLADVRRAVADLTELKIAYADADTIRGRYAELMAINAGKKAKAA